MDDLARSFHFENLKRALSQFARGESVVPMISYMKGTRIVEVSWAKGTVEAALHVIEEEFEPDALNLVVMPRGPIPFSEGGGAPLVPKQILFAMTFDHLGNRWVSLFEVRRQGEFIDLKDVGPKDIGTRKVTVSTTSGGDLDIRIDPMPAKSRSQDM